jgi:alpha-tubulin suppressor-like RCC1 family protein
MSACDSAGPSGNQPVLTKIVAGSGSTCALTDEGLAYCWGQLFDEETASDPTCEAATGTRCRTRPDTLAFGMRFRDLRLAANIFGHTICGITTESRGYCWGTLSSGEDAGLVIGSVPQPLGAALPLQSISVASHHFCAILTSGVTQCWGDYSGGARGTGQPLLQYVPADLSPNAVAGGLAFTDLGLGFASSCGLLTGAAYCWGWEVTVGSTGASLSAAVKCGWDIAPVLGRCSHVPVPVAGEHTFATLAAGQNHACGLTDSGEVYCWGSNESGQLGAQSSTSGAPVRAAVPEGVQAVAVGSEFTCALGVSGLAYCWGLTHVGQSGSRSSLSPLPVPTPVAGGVRYRGIAAGHTHVCALRVSGGVDCWGSNDRGELGTGDRANSDVPRPVQF